MADAPTVVLRRRSTSSTTTPVVADLPPPAADRRPSADDVPEAGAEGGWRILFSPAPTKFQGIKRAAKQRQNEIDKRSAKMFAVHQKVSEAIRSRKTYSEIRSLINASNVVVSLPNERQKKMEEVISGKEAVAERLNISYRQQGNLDMYSSDNVKLRERNRHDPQVKAATDRFWNLLPKTAAGNINKSMYAWYSRHLFFTFVTEGTEQEFQQVVQEDWKNDAVYSCSMNERMFAFAIFNLADIWCESMDPKEYAEFIGRCADVIAAAPAYTGTRKEGDVTDSNDRATGRRLSMQPGATERRRPSGFEVFDEEEDEEVPVEETLEQLERDMMCVENNAWYSTLHNVGKVAGEQVGDCEEDIVRFFHQVQDRRYDLFHDEEDPSFKLEANFMKEVELDSKRRTQLNEDIQVRLDILKRPPPKKGDIAAQKKRREKETAQHHKEQRELLHDMRETWLHGFVRLREYRNSLMDLGRGAFKETLSRVDKSQSDLRAFFALQQSDAARRTEMDSERNDDYFTTIMDVTKDLEEFRKIMTRRQDEPLEAEIYVVTAGQKDTNCMELDSQKWVSACEWFEKLRMMRTEAVEQVIFEIDELVTRAQFRGKQQLFAIHRQQMDFEVKLIDALAETNLLANDIKIARLSEAEKAKAEGSARRAKETEDFQSLVAGWKDVMTAIMESHQQRIKAESNETRQWAKATSIETAFDASRGVLTIMADDCAELEMEETSRTEPRIVTELPMGASTPMQLLKFVLAQYDSWTISFMEKVAMSRTTVLEQSHQFLYRIEAAEEVRQFENNIFLLSMRLDDIHRIKGELTPEQAKQMLTASCELRLNHSSDVKDALGEMEELLDMTRAAAERFALLLEQRHAERRAALAKTFVEQRYNILKFFELEQLRTQTWEYRYTNQTAAQRKAAQQASMISDLRRKEDERLRLAREKRMADEAEAEKLRYEKMREAEEHQRKAREKKELRAKDQAEIRKKHMKEREAQIQQRIQREKEERHAWREAFLKEQSDQKDRSRGYKSTPPTGGAKPAKQQPTQAAGPPPTTQLVRRKKPEDALKTEKSKPRASARIQKTIEAEVAMFRNLNSESMAVDVNNFNTRRMEYLLEGASNKSIYRSECARLNAELKASVEIILSEEPLEFQLSQLQVSHFVSLNIRTLFDVIELNPIQKFLARGIGMDKDDLKKLAQHFLTHPFIHVIDVSGNKDLGPHGGQTLLTLAQENKRISSIAADDCGIEDAVLKEITETCQKNQFARGFSRTDFEFIYAAFKQIDADGNGTVEPAEIQAYIKASSPKKGESTVDIGKSTIVASTEKRHDDIRAVLLAMDTQAKGKKSFALEDLLVNVYPHLTAKDAHEMVKRYTDDSQSSLDTKELEEFMETYGTNGTLTLEQLAIGLDEDPVSLEAAFQEADLDDDGVLNIAEFMVFVNH